MQTDTLIKLIALGLTALTLFIGIVKILLEIGKNKRDSGLQLGKMEQKLETIQGGQDHVERRLDTAIPQVAAILTHLTYMKERQDHAEPNLQMIPQLNANVTHLKERQDHAQPQLESLPAINETLKHLKLESLPGINENLQNLKQAYDGFSDQVATAIDKHKTECPGLHPPNGSKDSSVSPPKEETKPVPPKLKRKAA